MAWDLVLPTRHDMLLRSGHVSLPRGTRTFHPQGPGSAALHACSFLQPEKCLPSACLKLSSCVWLHGGISHGSGVSFWTACTAGEQLLHPLLHWLPLPPRLPPHAPPKLLPHHAQLLVHAWLLLPPPELLQHPWLCP